MDVLRQINLSRAHPPAPEEAWHFTTQMAARTIMVLKCAIQSKLVKDVPERFYNYRPRMAFLIPLRKLQQVARMREATSGTRIT